MGMNRDSYSFKNIALLIALSFALLSSPGSASAAQPSNLPPSRLIISTSSMPSGTAGSVYSVTLTTSGGTAPHQWSVTAGVLPAGLTLNASSGAITGTPRSAGMTNFTIQVRDSKQQVASAKLDITVAPATAVLSITTTSLSSATVRTAYSATLATSGGTAPHQWSITAGALPAGLTLNVSSGAISGSPTSVGTANFTIQVRDSKQQVASAKLDITVAPATAVLSITTTSLSNATVRTAYSATLATSGGTAPHQWSITAGVLPAGLTLNASSGAITGTPRSAGMTNFTIQVRDSKQQVASAKLDITVAPAIPVPSITTTSLSSATVRTAYSATLTASGGTPPYQWSITAGALPAGLTLGASSGAISGSPTSAGTANFTIQVQDSEQQTASTNLAITVAATSAVLSVATTSLSSGTVGKAYSATLTASGGTPPYQWSITAGALPAGLTLNASSGALSGTPTSSTTASITVELMDSSIPVKTVSKNFSIVISASGPPPGAVVVTNFGATGNGSTDDTNAINAAIASLQAGNTLYFPCGTYLISAALTPISLSDIQVLGPTSNCVTLHVVSANSFHALSVNGKGLSSAQNLAADTTANTFTLVAGGVAALGLSVGDYAMISDTGVADNGSDSPVISTQEVVQVTGISGDTVTIQGNFAWQFTLVSAEPAQWGGSPFAQKVNPVSDVIVKYLTIDGTGSTGKIRGMEFDNAVNGEVGFITIKNFTAPTGNYGFNPDTGYQNNFHDLTLTNAASGPLTAEGEAVFILRQSYLTLNNVHITATAGQGVFGFGYHDSHWGTLSNITINLNGATGRVFKTLRADHNTFNAVVAMNGVGHNGISITDVSQYNTFNNCSSTGNDTVGIDMFGSYDVGNTFNNCTSKLNQGKQVNFSSGFSGQYADDNTTFNGGFFGDARGSGVVIIQQNGTGFVLNGATVSDDEGMATAGLAVDGTNCSVTNSTFSGLPAGQDVKVKTGVGCTFAGNTTPDGTTPSGLASLFKTVKSLYALLTNSLWDDSRRR